MASIVRVIPETLYQKLLSSGSLESSNEKLAETIVEKESGPDLVITQVGEGPQKEKKCSVFVSFEDKFVLK